MSNEHSRARGAAEEEALALLKYMAEHNAHHAEELQALETGLPEKAAAYVREAAALLNASTEALRSAIRETEA